jgi:SSS family solute:Na+ symporter
MYAIDFQFLGGSWMLQIFPALIFGLYTRWFHPKALLIGWLCGMIAATAMGFSNYASGVIVTVFPMHIFGATLPGFVAFYALVLNVIVAAGLTWAFRGAKLDAGVDATSVGDYA